MSRQLRRAAGLAAPALALALLPFTGLSADAASPAPAAATSTSSPPTAASGPAERRGSSLWRPSSAKPKPSHEGHRRTVNPSSYQAFTLSKRAMRKRLAKAPHERSRAARRGRAVTVAVPAPTGELIRFEVVESPVMQRRLQRKHRNIRTYAGRSVTEGFEGTIRLDRGPLGLHASVVSGQQSWYVDPAYVGDTSLYLSYFGQSLPKPEKAFVEPTLPRATRQAIQQQVARRIGEGPGALVQRRDYRLALVTDPSYAAYFGASSADNAVSDPLVLAAKVTLMNRVNQIYNDDLGVRLLLVNGTDKLNFQTAAEATGTNGPCGGSACYSTDDMSGCGNVIDTNTNVLGLLIGAENYDIGHIAFGPNGDGGGVAYLGSVGMGDIKGGGCTGLNPPTGDFFAIDYVAHEMGHQFGANHTFNATQGSCGGGNRNAGTSVEPGSGSSVMAYAGICAQSDLQPHTDPYFSQRSQTEITAHVTGSITSYNEIQRFGLGGFTSGEAFRLSFGGTQTAVITSGSNYTASGIKTAVEAVTGGTATVSSVTANGFTITYSGALAATNVTNPSIVPTTGTFSAVGGDYVKGGPNTRRGTAVTTTNHNPTVSAPADKSIPIRTPFALTGSATDTDGDSLVYLWEQNDTTATGTSLLTQPKTSGALFRVFGKYANVTFANSILYGSPGQNLATTSPTRTFPDMAQVLAGQTNAATGSCPASSATTPLPDGATLECYSEFLPTALYTPSTLTFRLTARDQTANGGGTHVDDTVLTLDKLAGPFLATSQATNVSYAGGSTQTVTWNVANTNTAALAQNVKISLSTDGGLTFPHVMLASTPNDGTQAVTIPNVGTTQARIKIEAVDNYFFDVNDSNFTVVQTLVNTAQPQISGTPAPGSLLTASTGTWSPASTGHTYQWFANASPIPGATGQTFTPTAAQEGKLVAVEVTASRSGFTSATRSSPGVRIATTAIQNTSPPVVSGTPTVGSVLSLSTGTWNYGDLTFAFQWYADGAAIRGANQSTYTISPSMTGRTITGRVTATRPGSDAVVAVSSNSVIPS